MNKLYIMAASVLVAFTASAVPATPIPRSEVQKQKSSVNLPACSSITLKSPISAKKKFPAKHVDGKDITAYDLEGEWSFLMNDVYFGNASEGAVEIPYIAKVQSDGKLGFVSQDRNRYDMIASYEDGLLFFDEVLVAEGSTMTGAPVYIYQSPFVWNEMTADFDYQSIAASYNDDLGSLSFYANNGMAWEGYRTPDPSADNWIGYYDLLDFLLATQADDENLRWEKYGSAMFVDGWFQPGFGMDQTANAYEVPLQRNIANTNLYRLVDPYHRGPLADVNLNTTGGSIVFDVTNPEMVIFRQAISGFSYQELPYVVLSVTFCYNFVGAAMATYGFTPDEIFDALGTEIIYTKFADNKIELKQGLIDSKEEYDANFGWQERPTGGEVWQDQNNKLANMYASITLMPDSGVDGVESDDENAPEVYYNLQGVKLTNPEKGQLVIVKKGSKSEKRIF